MSRRLDRGRGHVLADALIALLVLCAGALAGARLQLLDQRALRHARLDTQATVLAVELGELARLYGADALAGAAPCGSACDAALAGWHARRRAALPGSRAVLCRDGRPWRGGYAWSCDGNADAPVWVKLGWDRDAAARLALPVADGGA